MNEPVVFLKLGGAVLTAKDRREAVRAEVLARLAAEVAGWWRSGRRRLVLAHGSGSFAHVAVREAGLLDRPGDPLAVARVAASARRLDALVVEALVAEGLPALPVPGSLLALVDGGRVVGVRSALVRDVLAAGLVPVVYGDAAPDRTRGGAVASTEPLLAALAADLRPVRIVLATDVDGVFAADPHAHPDARPIGRLGPAEAEALAGGLGGVRRDATDVSGGMASKVTLMLAAAAAAPDMEVRIVSGLRPGAVAAALAGDPDAGGTLVVG